MDKKKLKERWKKAKSWCKDHGTEILYVATTAIVGGIVAGSGYKKGFNDGVDACEKEVEEHCAYLKLTEPLTPRDLMNAESIKKTIDNRENGAADCLDKEIKEIQFWF